MIHQRLLWALGVGAAVALALAGAWIWSIGVAAASALYAATSRAPLRLQLASAYVYTLGFYRGVEWITPAIGTPGRDAALLAADVALFGETPAVSLGAVATVGLSEVLSACYLSYHFYLHGALAWAIWRRDRVLFDWVFTAFAIGLLGYLFVPAMGPALAYPELFSGPVIGGWMTTFTAETIAQGTSIWDCFPSLHLLITMTLLDHDWRRCRRRFWWMIGPAMGLVVATLYLRYHYAVDLLAGLVAWGIVREVVIRSATPEDAPG